MTFPVHTCSAKDPLDKVAGLMWTHDCGILPVVDKDGRIGAAITDRDICMAAYTQGRRLADLRVADSMSRKLISCKPDDDLQAAALLMAQHRVRRLPVVDEQGKLCGILSLNDLARAAPKHAAVGGLALQALTAVCEPRAATRAVVAAPAAQQPPRTAPAQARI
jgi:CBS-domain-containing membrane protein